MSLRILGYLALVWMLAILSASNNQAAAQASSTKWTPIGKGIINANPGDAEKSHHQSGRLIQAAWSLDNKQARKILWMGAAVGGLWKSEVNSQGTIEFWVTVTDTFPGPHSMGAFLVHRLNSDMILIGPGSIWESSGNGYVYLTRTQGTTWERHELLVDKKEKAVTRINRLVADSSDLTGNTVLACTDHGIYKSIDFGTSWTRVFKGENKAADEVTDIVQDTKEDKIWYAAKLFNGMILQSVDSGNTWNLFVHQDKIPGAAGRISLAACDADPNVLYALVIDTDSANTVAGQLKGVYRSMDRAQNWTRIYKDNAAINGANQGMHTCAIACDPADAKHIFFGLQQPVEIMNATEQDVNTIKWRDPVTESLMDGGHSDYNFILFRPGMKNIVLVNDGGYYVYDPATMSVDDSGNLLGINATFLEISNGGLASSRNGPETFIAGLVDTGLVRGNATTGTGTLTLALGGTDGGQVSIMPESMGIMAASTNSGHRKESLDIGQHWLDISNGLVDDTYSSVLIDPTPGLSRPNIFNYAINPNLGPGTWSMVYFRDFSSSTSPWKLVAPLAQSGQFTHLDHTTDTANHTLILTLKDDQRLIALVGPRSQLGHLKRKDRTPTLPTLLGNNRDAHANADKSNLQPNTIYYTTNTSRPSRAFVSRDDGKHWTDVTGDLPISGPHFVKLIGNPKKSDQFFLATSNGVYRTDGKIMGKHHWYPYSDGLRLDEEVQDIVINSDQQNPATLYVATKGRGFWQRAIN